MYDQAHSHNMLLPSDEANKNYSCTSISALLGLQTSMTNSVMNSTMQEYNHCMLKLKLAKEKLREVTWSFKRTERGSEALGNLPAAGHSLGCA